MFVCVIDDSNVAILELASREEQDVLKLNIVEEKQYELVPRIEISDDDLRVLKEKEPGYLAGGTP